MNLDTANIATLLVLIFALVGGALVVISAVATGVDPALRLGFRDYVEAMSIAAAGLAVGRGIKAAGKGA